MAYVQPDNCEDFPTPKRPIRLLAADKAAWVGGKPQCDAADDEPRGKLVIDENPKAAEDVDMIDGHGGAEAFAKLIDYADGGYYSSPTGHFRRRTDSADVEEERPNMWRFGNWRIYPRMPSYCPRQEAYHCIVCGKHYRNIHECMIHMVTRCDLERVKVRCGVCGQGYHTERELEMHYKSRHVNLHVSDCVNFNV